MLSEQLRRARRECDMWRERAEAAERRVAVFERFSAKMRDVRDESRADGGGNDVDTVVTVVRGRSSLQRRGTSSTSVRAEDAEAFADRLRNQLKADVDGTCSEADSLETAVSSPSGQADGHGMADGLGEGQQQQEEGRAWDDESSGTVLRERYFSRGSATSAPPGRRRAACAQEPVWKELAAGQEEAQRELVGFRMYSDTRGAGGGSMMSRGWVAIFL